MKIQTIHAFCQALLARFPLEAGVAPHARVMDEREAAEMLDSARQRMLAAAREGPLAEAMADLTAYADEVSFDGLVRQLVAERSRLAGALRRLGGEASAIEAIHDSLGAVPGEAPRQIFEEAARVDPRQLGTIAEALEAGTDAEKKKAATIRAWLEASAEGPKALFSDYQAVFLIKEGRPRARLLSNKAASAAPAARAAMEAEAGRLEGLHRRLNAALVAQANAALLRIGIAILEAYETDKRRRALFDYDDLILLARNLLAGEKATPWVLYKLDGGIDHVMIDEAQDTNPEQWEVVRALTEEFFAGEGAREGVRTLFVVGDAKQSIYSFQRADPATFADMQDFFAEKVTAAGRLWRRCRVLRRGGAPRRYLRRRGGLSCGRADRRTGVGGDLAGSDTRGGGRAGDRRSLRRVHGDGSAVARCASGTRSRPADTLLDLRSRGGWRPRVYLAVPGSAYGPRRYSGPGTPAGRLRRGSGA
jgi:ATP-dependent helicase/nuclease subunit A